MTPHVQTYCSPSTLTNMEEVKVVVLHKTLCCFWRFFQHGAHIPCSYVDGSFVVPESSDSNSGLPKIGVHLTDALIILTFDLILMINCITLRCNDKNFFLDGQFWCFVVSLVYLFV